MKYELTYIISSDENLQGSELVTKSVEDFIVKEGGIVSTKETPSARNLAYPINKKSSGFLAIINFEADPEKIKNVEEFVKKEPKILRSALLKKKKVQPMKPRREASYAAPKLSRKDEKEVLNKDTKDAAPHTEEKKEVELKDIEEQLDKILND